MHKTKCQVCCRLHHHPRNVFEFSKHVRISRKVKIFIGPRHFGSTFLNPFAKPSSDAEKESLRFAPTGRRSQRKHELLYRLEMVKIQNYDGIKLDNIPASENIFSKIPKRFVVCENDDNQHFMNAALQEAKSNKISAWRAWSKLPKSHGDY